MDGGGTDTEGPEPDVAAAAATPRPPPKADVLPAPDAGAAEVVVAPELL